MCLGEVQGGSFWSNRDYESKCLGLCVGHISSLMPVSLLSGSELGADSDKDSLNVIDFPRPRCARSRDPGQETLVVIEDEVETVVAPEFTVPPQQVELGNSRM